jgi:hypothetical protein
MSQATGKIFCEEFTACAKMQPQSGDGLHEVYEVYGETAQANGWDFVVCRSLKDALAILYSDIDELDADPDAEDEVRIRFRRYTKEQMDEVYFE